MLIMASIKISQVLNLATNKKQILLTETMQHFRYLHNLSVNGGQIKHKPGQSECQDFKSCYKESNGGENSMAWDIMVYLAVILQNL